MNQQLRLDLGRARGDVGIERAAERANRSQPGWIDRAAEELRHIAAAASFYWDDGTFTIEQARAEIGERISAPPDGRAWGQVTRRAVKLDYIVRLPGKFRAAASSNGNPKPLYRKGPNA